MRKALLVIALVWLTLPGPSATAQSRFGSTYCEDDRFICREIQPGESWESLWSDPGERDLIKRINRMNIKLRKGMTIAVPKDRLARTNLDYSPFPRQIDPMGEKQLWIDLTQLAWGAYDSEGNLLRWGPVSGGKDWCPDINQSCKTPAGEFAISRKGYASCKSKKFPIPTGGAPMPYCMFFRGGYAVHGSYEVPGYRASHGCVRIFPEDAQWLNEEFVDLPDEEAGILGTKVFIHS